MSCRHQVAISLVCPGIFLLIWLVLLTISSRVSDVDTFVFVPPINGVRQYCFHNVHLYICPSINFWFLLLILLNKLSEGSHRRMMPCLQNSCWYFLLIWTCPLLQIGISVKNQNSKLWHLIRMLFMSHLFWVATVCKNVFWLKGLKVSVPYILVIPWFVCTMR